MKRLFWILTIIFSLTVILACDKNELERATTTQSNCRKYSNCAEYFGIPKKELINTYCNTESEKEYRKEKQEYYVGRIDKLTAAGKVDSIRWNIAYEMFFIHNKKLQEIHQLRKDIGAALQEFHGMTERDRYIECGWDTKVLDTPRMTVDDMEKLIKQLDGLIIR